MTIFLCQTILILENCNIERLIFVLCNTTPKGCLIVRMDVVLTLLLISIDNITVLYVLRS